MTEQQHKNGEIWSTRVQKELLALTTDNADAETTDEVRSMLPNFCKVNEHRLVIEQGDCIVLFEIAAADGMIAIVSIDASLAKTADGKIDYARPAYPFAEPWCVLQSGEEIFPAGSTIKNGDLIGMDPPIFIFHDFLFAFELCFLLQAFFLKVLHLRFQDGFSLGQLFNLHLQIH